MRNSFTTSPYLSATIFIWDFNLVAELTVYLRKNSGNIVKNNAELSDIPFILINCSYPASNTPANEPNVLINSCAKGFTSF